MGRSPLLLLPALPTPKSKGGFAMLVIGAIFVDVKGFSIGTYHPEGTNIGEIQVMPGGVCRNVAENLAHLGFESQFFSMVDDTAMGRDVKDGLRALGIDVTHVLSAPGAWACGWRYWTSTATCGAPSPGSRTSRPWRPTSSARARPWCPAATASCWATTPTPPSPPASSPWPSGLTSPFSAWWAIWGCCSGTRITCASPPASSAMRSRPSACSTSR